MRRNTTRSTGNALRDLRKSLGIGEAEMAGIIEKKSVNTYSYKERGLTSFAPHEMAKIADHLNMTTGQFNDIFFNGELRLRSKNALLDYFDRASEADKNVVRAVLEKYRRDGEEAV